jgi:hypothetical protein
MIMRVTLNDGIVKDAGGSGYCYHKVLSQHLSGGTEEYHKKSVSTVSLKVEH